MAIKSCRLLGFIGLCAPLSHSLRNCHAVMTPATAANTRMRPGGHCPPMMQTPPTARAMKAIVKDARDARARRVEALGCIGFVFIFILFYGCWLSVDAVSRLTYTRPQILWPIRFHGADCVRDATICPARFRPRRDLKMASAASLRAVRASGSHLGRALTFAGCEHSWLRQIPSQPETISNFVTWRRRGSR